MSDARGELHMKPLWLIFMLVVPVASCAANGRVIGRPVSNPCVVLSSIRLLPFKGETVTDDSYNQIMRDGLEAVGCLIDSITDTSRMPDPRKAPKYEGFVVGDAALMVLANLVGVRFEDLLPETVAREFPARGVDAYFEFVGAERDGRSRIREHVRRWWAIEKQHRRAAGHAGASGTVSPPENPMRSGMSQPQHLKLVSLGEPSR